MEEDEISGEPKEIVRRLLDSIQDARVVGVCEG